MLLLQVPLPTPTRARAFCRFFLASFSRRSATAVLAPTPARSCSRTRVCRHAVLMQLCTLHTRAPTRGVKVGPLAPFPLRQTSPGSYPPPHLEATSPGRASYPEGASVRSPSSAHTLSCERARRPSSAVATPAAPPSCSASVCRGRRAPTHVRYPSSRAVLPSTHTHLRTP
jgi:hypothetical protein